MVGGPENCVYNVSESGWMDDDSVFKEWFVNYFLKYMENKSKPLIVFFDGHGSNLTYETASKAKRAGVHTACLPPNTSSALQP